MSTPTCGDGGSNSFNVWKSVPRPIILRTIALWVCVFAIAFPDSGRGPTFLDVRDAVGITTQQMSSTFMFAAIGGLFGCLTAGIILDRLLPSTRYLALCFCGCMVGLFSAAAPHSNGVYTILVCSLCYGFFNGLFHSCANVFLLNLWKGYNSSPCMYALHFFFGVGSLLSPVFAKPFLRHTPEKDDISLEETIGLNLTTTQLLTNESSLERVIPSQALTVRLLFPLFAIQLAILLTPLLYFYLQERRHEATTKSIACHINSSNDKKTIKDPDMAGEDKKDKVETLVLVSVMFLVYFCFAGLEISMRTFISPFTVSIGHSRQVGSDITALYYLSYTAARGMAVFGGVYLSPSTIMWGSQLVLSVGSVILSIHSVHSFWALRLGVILMGGGTAVLFPTGLLWLKDEITINNQIGSSLLVGMNISAQLYTFFIGYIIDDEPLMLMYLMNLTACILLLLFSLASLLARHFTNNKRNTQEKSKP